MTGRPPGRTLAPRRQSGAKGKQKQVSDEQDQSSGSGNKNSDDQVPQVQFIPSADPSLASTAASSASPAPKVAIPRLQNPVPPPSLKSQVSAEKPRVNHACMPCRQRKTKCSGEKPSCKHCTDIKIECHYTEGKRDKLKKQFGQMRRKIELYEQLLREAGDHLGHAAWSRLQDIVTRDVEDVDSRPAQSPRKSTHSVSDSDSEDDESQDSTLQSLDLDRNVDEFVLDSIFAGYVGKMSDVTWLRQLEDLIELDGNTPALSSPMNSNPHSGSAYPSVPEASMESQDLRHKLRDKQWSYYLDNRELLDVNEVHIYDDSPTSERIGFLLGVYLDFAHPGFPILSLSTFVQDVRNYLANQLQGMVAPLGNVWLAILNFVLAIAANCSHGTRLETKKDDHEHALLFTRARVLLAGTDLGLEKADLPLVQAFGLMAFYLMSVGQINRAWNVNGIAMRSAIALGLHLRDRNEEVTDPVQQCKYNTWWSLYSLDSLLGNMTGRPEAIALQQFNTPLPSVSEGTPTANSAARKHQAASPSTARRSSAAEHSARMLDNPAQPARKEPLLPSDGVAKGMKPLSKAELSIGLYFRCQVHLDLIGHEISAGLYKSGGPRPFWPQTNAVILTINHKLENWLAGLPAALNFTMDQSDPRFAGQRANLGYAYYSTKMILHRPCLCRPQKPILAGKTKETFQAIAAVCVVAARDMVNLLPVLVGRLDLYPVAPWWCLSHYLMQATTIMMLELHFRAEQSATEESRPLLQSCRKAILWLHHLAQGSHVARRAWMRSNAIFRNLVARLGTRLDDMPSEPPPMAAARDDMRPRPDLTVRIGAMQPSHGPMMGLASQLQHGGSIQSPQIDGVVSLQGYDAYGNYLTYASNSPLAQTTQLPVSGPSMGNLPPQSPAQYGYYRPQQQQGWEAPDGEVMADEDMEE